ncbi:hypothetical protein NDU88_000669 [Pleurodeles waltl]|uniref:Uncharacterized protein n=1 Tax=Pleurodeles waltl TaxID=8319 RepID=A0AAV7KQN1_PLEWA|nr:hypothetical protein NDU88_000669 [Pleurodeles waltl]
MCQRQPGPHPRRRPQPAPASSGPPRVQEPGRQKRTHPKEKRRELPNGTAPYRGRRNTAQKRKIKGSPPASPGRATRQQPGSPPLPRPMPRKSSKACPAGQLTCRRLKGTSATRSPLKLPGAADSATQRSEAAL